MHSCFFFEYTFQGRPSNFEVRKKLLSQLLLQTYPILQFSVHIFNSLFVSSKQLCRPLVFDYNPLLNAVKTVLKFEIKMILCSSISKHHRGDIGKISITFISMAFFYKIMMSMFQLNSLLFYIVLFLCTTRSQDFDFVL